MGPIHDAATHIEAALERSDAAIERFEGVAAAQEVLSQHVTSIATALAGLAQTSSAIAEQVAALADQQAAMSAALATLQALHPDPAPPPEQAPDPAPEPAPEPESGPEPEPPRAPPVEPAPEPPPIPAERAARYASYEEFSDGSLTHTHFNRIGGLAWRRPGGDWMDASGVPHGDAAWSAVDLTQRDVGAFVMDATDLARAWLAGTNRGVFLRPVPEIEGTSLLIRSRESVDPSQRPVLVVWSAGTEYVCPCVADTSTSASTTQPQGERDRLTILRGMLRFDLAGVPADIERAEMRLDAWRIYRDHTLQAHMIWPPVPFDANPDAVLGGAGLAAEVGAGDLSGHDDVLIDFDWYGDWRSNPAWSMGGLSVKTDSEPEQFVGPDGDTWLRVAMPTDPTATGAGEGTGLSVTVQIGEVPERLLPLPDGPFGPEELFAQYSLMLGEDWTAVHDRQLRAGKLPGLCGQYGQIFRRAGVDYWQRRMDGGRATSGRFEYFQDRPDSNTLQGWSGRAGFHNAAAYGQHDDPMRMCTSLSNYLYLPDNPLQGTGEGSEWANCFMEAGRPYVLEQQVRMNTIDMSNADEWGNGVGLPDGVLRWWLDGVLVYERTDRVFRHNPATAIDSWWGTLKHGGTEAPVLPHTMSIGRVTIARRYIGLRSQG